MSLQGVATCAALHIGWVWSPLSSVADIGAGGVGVCGRESLLTLEADSSSLSADSTTTGWKVRHATVNCNRYSSSHNCCQAPDRDRQWPVSTCGGKTIHRVSIVLQPHNTSKPPPITACPMTSTVLLTAVGNGRNWAFLLPYHKQFSPLFHR